MVGGSTGCKLMLTGGFGAGGRDVQTCAVLVLQIERYNALLVAVRRSCAELVKGIKGLVVMSADLDQVC